MIEGPRPREAPPGEPCGAPGQEPDLARQEHARADEVQVRLIGGRSSGAAGFDTVSIRWGPAHAIGRLRLGEGCPRRPWSKGGRCRGGNAHRSRPISRTRWHPRPGPRRGTRRPRLASWQGSSRRYRALRRGSLSQLVEPRPPRQSPRRRARLAEPFLPSLPRVVPAAARSPSPYTDQRCPSRRCRSVGVSCAEPR